MIRVLHFSDVHVQEPISAMPVGELMSKRLLAAGNLYLHRGKLFRDALTKVEALTRFAREQRIDAVVCTGDYTAVGSEAEHVRARAAIAPLAEAVQVYVTLPGNHDLYLADTVRCHRFERHFGDLQRSDLPELANDGLYPLVRFVGDELAVVGVNSAKPNPNPFLSTGCIPPVQLDALARVLDHPRVRDRIVLVMTHYGVLRRDGKPDSARHGLDNADELMRICARPRTSVLHGHIHWRFAHAATEARPWLFCSGSVTYEGREGLWVYEVEDGVMRAIPGDYQDGQYRLDSAQALPVFQR